MPYIGRDGRVMERQSPWRLSIILDILQGIWNFILIFFKSMTTSKDRLPGASSNRTTYAQRQGIRRPTNNDGGNGGSGGPNRSNIRGMRNLGTAQAPCGGGG